MFPSNDTARGGHFTFAARRVPKTRRAGFSLTELLVVLVILGLLMGLVAQNYLGKADQARVTTAELQIENLHGALKSYRLDIGRYPTTEQGLAALMKAPTQVQDYWHGPYLDKELPSDPWNTPYRYRYPVDNLQGLALYSLGPDATEGGEDDNADIGILPDPAAE